MMRFYRELLEGAGLGLKSREVSVSILGAAALLGITVFAVSGVLALALCLVVLAVAAGLELLRVRATSRQAMFDRLWPQVFDSFQNASLSGIQFVEQLNYLAESGPERLRQHFAQLGRDLELGNELELCLAKFRASLGSRQGDFLSLLIELSTELGGYGMSKTWGDAASELRQEQALMGQVLAKQGWVSASAKVALIAPWLIALVLIQLPQNREAFATDMGALVLVLGLGLSFIAYTLVNKLGRLTLPGRIFYGA